MVCWPRCSPNPGGLGAHEPATLSEPGSDAAEPIPRILPCIQNGWSKFPMTGGRSRDAFPIPSLIALQPAGRGRSRPRPSLAAYLRVEAGGARLPPGNSHAHQLAAGHGSPFVSPPRRSLCFRTGRGEAKSRFRFSQGRCGRRSFRCVRGKNELHAGHGQPHPRYRQ